MEDYSGYPIHASQHSIPPLSVNTENQQKQIKTVKISNLSLGASPRNIKDFFSCTGDIDYVEMHCDYEHSQIAFVTFKEPQGAESAILLSGSTIVDLTVTITPARDHQLPRATSLSPLATERGAPGGAESAFHMAEEVVNSILAKGYVLGKDTINRAKSFDEKHQLTSTTSTKVREVDQKLQVSGKVKSAYLAAGQTVNSARFAIMKNDYVYKGASWVTEAFNKVAKVAGEVGQNTKGKLGIAGEEPRRTMNNDSAQVHLSKSPKTSNGSGRSPSKSSLDKLLLLLFLLLSPVPPASSFFSSAVLPPPTPCLSGFYYISTTRHTSCAIKLKRNPIE